MSALLLEHDDLRVLQPALVQAFNKTQAMFLQQLHYLAERGLGIIRDGKIWIYNTAAQWGKELMIGERQATRIISELKGLGIIQVEKLSKNQSNRTNYITLDYDALNEFLNSEATLPQTRAEEDPVLDTDKMSESSGQNVRMVILRDHTQNKEDKLIKLIEEKKSSKKRRGKGSSSGTSQTPHPLSKNNSSEEEKEEGEKQKTTIAQDMLSIWNQTFPQAKTRMSKDLAPLLVAAFKRLGSNLDRWKHYCHLMDSSPYLTAENFSLSLNWALKFSIMERIEKGEFGVSKQLLEYRPPLEQRNEEAEKHINSLRGKEPEICLRLRLWFVKKYGPDAYKSWIQDACMYLDDGKVFIDNLSSWKKHYILNNFFLTINHEYNLEIK